MALAARAGAAGAELDARYVDVTWLGTTSGVSQWHARDRATRRPLLLQLAERPSHRHPVTGYEQLERQAALLAAVGTHPNVHTLYQRLELPSGALVLELERCLGSVAEVYDQVSVAMQSAVSMGVQLAGALETLHRAGIVHAAVGPDTVLMTEWGAPVLTELGDALPVDEIAAVTSPSVHIAPEVLLGEPVGAATDVYGLASLLYWLVAGRPAITAAGGLGPAAVSASVLCSSVTPIHRAEVPIDLSDLLVWALAADPTSRPSTAVWFGEELRRIEKAAGWQRTPITIGSGAES